MLNIYIQVKIAHRCFLMNINLLLYGTINYMKKLIFPKTTGSQWAVEEGAVGVSGATSEPRAATAVCGEDPNCRQSSDIYQSGQRDLQH